MLTHLLRRNRRNIIRPKNSFHIYKRYASAMSSLHQFVADVQAADPSLAGESDKDKSEITKLAEQIEGLSKDLPVSFNSPHARCRAEAGARPKLTCRP